jgi:hypothetical protein
MSDIVESLKDVIIPSRREQATGPTYDPKARGPFPDPAHAGDGQPELVPPSPEEPHKTTAQGSKPTLSIATAGAKQRTNSNSNEEGRKTPEDPVGAKPVCAGGEKFGLS